VERCLACEADAIGTPGGELLERLPCHHVIFFVLRIGPENVKAGGSCVLPTVWLRYELVKSIHFANRIAVQKRSPGHSREPPVATRFGHTNDRN
jgi:hypothetical protein